MTTTNDITEALTQLHEDRDKYVRRSAEALLDIDISNMDFFYVDPILKTWLMDSTVAVSYTHLTLPTICSV